MDGWVYPVFLAAGFLIGAAVVWVVLGKRAALREGEKAALTERLTAKDLQIQDLKETAGRLDQ